MEVKGEELVSILRDKIKLYEHLGIEVIEISAQKVHFKVALEKNLNHKGTAFGGSLYASAVLAAYALVLAGLREHRLTTENIVIAKGEISYLLPVETDFEILTQFDSKEAAQDFFTKLQSEGRVRKVVKSEVRVAGSLKAVLKGTFVVRI